MSSASSASSAGTWPVPPVTALVTAAAPVTAPVRVVAPVRAPVPGGDGSRRPPSAARSPGTLFPWGDLPHAPGLPRPAAPKAAASSSPPAGRRYRHSAAAPSVCPSAPPGTPGRSVRMHLWGLPDSCCSVCLSGSTPGHPWTTGCNRPSVRMHLWAPWAAPSVCPDTLLGHGLLVCLSGCTFGTPRLLAAPSTLSSRTPGHPRTLRPSVRMHLWEPQTLGCSVRLSGCTPGHPQPLCPGAPLGSMGCSVHLSGCTSGPRAAPSVCPVAPLAAPSVCPDAPLGTPDSWLHRPSVRVHPWGPWAAPSICPAAPPGTPGHSVRLSGCTSGDFQTLGCSVHLSGMHPQAPPDHRCTVCLSGCTPGIHGLLHPSVRMHLWEPPDSWLLRPSVRVHPWDPWAAPSVCPDALLGHRLLRLSVRMHLWGIPESWLLRPSVQGSQAEPGGQPPAGPPGVGSSSEDDAPLAQGSKRCASCKTRRTPLWRAAENGTPLCNACGIRYKKYRVRCRRCWNVPGKSETPVPMSPLRGAVSPRRRRGEEVTARTPGTTVAAVEGWGGRDRGCWGPGWSLGSN
ncbi:GATA-type zinc finger protein 1 [Chroicocephalus ridibundus]|uniref:GATA-type zinc finger protein 1 n=1 Tax=Chroicocephalus ridibundus TaxID=1192867 RepID=UPI002FDC9B29